MAENQEGPGKLCPFMFMALPQGVSGGLIADPSGAPQQPEQLQVQAIFLPCVHERCAIGKWDAAAGRCDEETKMFLLRQIMARIGKKLAKEGP